MDANVIGLCFLVLWTSGLAEAFHFREDNAINEFPRNMPTNFWRNSKRPTRHDYYMKWFQWKHKYDPLDYNLKVNDLLPNSEFKQRSNQQSKLKFVGDKFYNGLNEAFVPIVPESKFNLNHNSVKMLDSSEQSASSRLAVNKIRDIQRLNIGSRMVNVENLVNNSIQQSSGNNITFSSGSDSSTSSKVTILHSESTVQSINIQPDTDLDISKSESKITPVTNISIVVTSQGTAETKVTSESNDPALNSTKDSFPNENSTATGIPNVSTTRDPQKSTEFSSKNVSDSSTIENSTGNDTVEIGTSSTDFDLNSTVGDTTLFKDSTNTSISENIASLNVTSDNPVPHANTTTSDVIQTGQSGQTSPFTKEDKTETTSNQDTVPSKVESTVTENTISPTEGTSEAAISPTFGSTKSKSNIDVTETIPPDHVISIPSIKTARVIVSLVFIVIALVGVVVIAIFVFRAKRRTVEYDQLMLLP